MINDINQINDVLKQIDSLSFEELDTAIRKVDKRSYKMNKQEAIDELIANAVCGEPKLYCDMHCPYYIEGKDCKRIGVNFKLEEAVKVLIQEKGENK